MLDSKMALAALFALVGLFALAVPRPELDHEELVRRRVAKRQLDYLDEILGLNRRLIATGAYDGNTLFNILQVYLNRNFTARQLHGDSMQLLREYESVFPEVCRLHNELLDQSEKARASERVGGSYEQLRSFVAPLRELKVKLGVQPGQEEAVWKRFVARITRPEPPPPPSDRMKLVPPVDSAAADID